MSLTRGQDPVSGKWRDSLRKTWMQPGIGAMCIPPGQAGRPPRIEAGVSSGKLHSSRVCRCHQTRQQAECHDRMHGGHLLPSGLCGFRPAAGIQASQDQRQQRTQELHVTVFKRFKTSGHGYGPRAVHPVRSRDCPPRHRTRNCLKQTVDRQCQDVDRTAANGGSVESLHGTMRRPGVNQCGMVA